MNEVYEIFFKKYNFSKKLNFLPKKKLIDISYVNLPRSLKYMDRLAMNFSIENRVPFLDHDLASFCFNLENNNKINNNETRFIMKKIFKKYHFFKYFTKTKKIIVDPPKYLGMSYLSFFMMR